MDITPKTDKSPNQDGTNPRRQLIATIDYICDRYIEKHGAYSDLIRSIAPQVETLLDSEDMQRGLLSANMDIVPDSKRPAFIKVMDKANKRGDGSFPLLFNDLLDAFGGESWCYKFIEGMHKIMMRQPRLPILLESLVVAVVSNFEVQLAQIASAFYREAPGALDASSSEKEFSLKELKEIGNLDDAMDMAISKRVENLLFGSLGDWRKFFNDRMKMKLDELCIDWDTTREIFQRRHVIVHNGGIASRRYVSQVRDLTGVEDVEIGSPLECNETYVERSMDELLTLGVLLGYDFCRRFANDPEYVEMAINSFAYRMLVDGRWRVTIKICRYGIDNLALNEETKNILQVNSWIARKKLGEAGKVKGEVEEWDVSALATRFELARYCLLEQHDRALECLASIVTTRDISLEDALEWPLLNDLREDGRFSMILTPLRMGPDSLLTDGKLIMSPGSTTVHIYPCKRAGTKAQPVHMLDVIQRNGRPCRLCSPSLST